MLEQLHRHIHYSVTSPLLSLIYLLFIGLILSNGCAVNQAQIQSVTPSTVVYGKPASINISVDHITSETDVVLAPGGPYTSHVLPLGHIQQLISHNDRILAIDATGGLQVLNFNGNTFNLISNLSLDGAITQIAIDANRLFLAESGFGLRQFELSRSGKLVQLSQFPVAQSIYRLAIDDRYIYFLTGKPNSADKQQLHRISRMKMGGKDKAAYDSITPLEWSVHDLKVAEGKCYLAGPQLGLGVYDCSVKSPNLLDHFITNGSAQQIALQQHLAYIADGKAGVVVLDINDPNHIQWLGSHNKLGGRVDSIAVHGDTAIVSNSLGTEANHLSRLVSLNVSNPQLPITGSFYKFQGDLQSFTLLTATPLTSEQQSITEQSPTRGDSMDTAHDTPGHDTARPIVIAATDRDLHRIDFSTPARIQISNEGINLGGSRRAFIKDNIAYVADWFSGLHMYDISIPSAPKHIGNFHTPGSSKGVVVKDHYAFVGDDDHGLQIIDVKDPAHPVQVSNMMLTGLAYTLKIVGDRLYLADHRGGFHIIDISDVHQPRHLSNVDTPGKSWAIDVTHTTIGDVAFVADDSDGLLIFDVHDDHHPALLAQFDPGSHERGHERGYAEDVLVKNGLAYISFFDMGLYIVDVTDPAHPREVSHLAIPGNARSIKLQGDYAYIAGWESGLQIVDISDPQHPKITGYYDTNGSAWGADIDHDHAYVWDWWGGVKVVDISNSRHPVLAGQYQGRSDIEVLRQQDNFLYCANGSAGVQVFDINNPLNPIWTTGVDTPSAVHDVWLDNTLAYAASDKGIVIIDISDHFQVHAINQISTPVALQRITAGTNFVFAIDEQGKLLQFSKQPDAHLELRHSYPLAATDLWLSGHWLYVTTQHQGLILFDTSTDDGLLHKQAHYSIAHSTRVTGNGSATNNNVIALLEPEVGVHLISLAENGHSFQRLALIDMPLAAVTDLSLNDAGLDIYSPELGLLHYVIDDAAENSHKSTVKPRLMARYPATGRHQRFMVHGDDAFFAGENTIASVSLIPDFSITPASQQSLHIELPAHMPLGDYHVGIKNPMGPVRWSYNALNIRLAKRKSPKFTLEDFNKILKQQQ